MASVPDKVVLIVDDDHLIQRMLNSIVSSMDGTKAIIASTSEEALQILRNQHVDMVISDLNMPGETGLWLLGQIKNEGMKTPLVIYSGSLVAGELEKAISQGAARVIAKPVAPSDIKNLIREILKI